MNNMAASAVVRQLRPTVLLGPWITPPEYVGKPTEISYATDGLYLYRRTRSAADVIYHRTGAALCIASDFEPWERSPNVPAKRWQFCTAEQAGDV